jgi:hypothetical protein
VDKTFLGEWVEEKLSYQYYNNYISMELIATENSDYLVSHTLSIVKTKPQSPQPHWQVYGTLKIAFL